MSEKKRNKFTAQFKAKVALEAIRSDKTLNEIGSEFGVHPSQVGQWKLKLLEIAPAIINMKRGSKPVDPSSDPEKLYIESLASRFNLIGFIKVEPYL